jgi:hypothetical protein
VSQTQINPAAFLPLQSALSVGSGFPLYAGANYTPGSARRNSFRMQGQRNVDASITKNVKVRERMNLQMRMEVYNVFNRTTFNIPARTVDSTTPLGRITGDINLFNYVNSARTSGNRMGQLVLRFTF